MSGQFSANASALGYFYQARYALMLLMNEGKIYPDAEMSIERFDDVAFEQAANPTELIQTKHHLNKLASLSDTSADLWKTIRIWCTESLKHNWDVSKIIFTLVTTAMAPEASIASKLRLSESGGRDVESALIDLRNVANTSSSKENKSAYDAFLGLDENQQRLLINNVRVLDSSPNIMDVQSKILTELRYTTRFFAKIYERLEGWWFCRVIDHLSRDSQGTISHKELLEKIYELQDQFHQDNLPIDFSGPINIDSPEYELNTKQRIFVEQLQLVEVGPKRTRMAISDFHKAYRQRSRWIREEVALIDEIIHYEDNLYEEWVRCSEIRKERLVRDKNVSEEKKQSEGWELFNEIEKLNFPIRPRCTEPYITRGSYHILANQLRLGWHLEFLERLGHLLNLPEEITA